jgi:hypothetical protein
MVLVENLLTPVHIGPQDTRGPPEHALPPWGEPATAEQQQSRGDARGEIRCMVTATDLLDVRALAYQQVNRERGTHHRWKLLRRGYYAA